MCHINMGNTAWPSNQNSLPELDDGWSRVSQFGAGHIAADGSVSEAAVSTVLVTKDLDAAGRVPFVITGGPGQDAVKGLDQVVEAPGQHHDVVGVAEKHDHHGGITQAWGRGGGAEHRVRSLNIKMKIQTANRREEEEKISRMLIMITTLTIMTKSIHNKHTGWLTYRLFSYKTCISGYWQATEEDLRTSGGRSTNQEHKKLLHTLNWLCVQQDDEGEMSREDWPAHSF